MEFKTLPLRKAQLLKIDRNNPFHLFNCKQLNHQINSTLILHLMEGLSIFALVDKGVPAPLIPFLTLHVQKI